MAFKPEENQVLVKILSKLTQTEYKNNINNVNNYQKVNDQIAPQNFDHILTGMERLVHIDLKGAPPKPDYLKKLIPFLKKHGASGLLLEYEDMFPFTGRLAEAKHGHAYTLEDILMIKTLAKENNLTIMPLIQTYGHLEWLLKVKPFAHLREDQNYPQVISPCLNETYTVLFGTICSKLSYKL